MLVKWVALNHVFTFYIHVHAVVQQQIQCSHIAQTTTTFARRQQFTYLIYVTLKMHSDL